MEYTYYKSSIDGIYNWKEISKEEIDEVFTSIDPVWRERVEDRKLIIGCDDFCYKAIHNCTIGMIAGDMISKSEWDVAREKHERAVELFNNSRKAVPYPGYIVRFQYCPVCGAKIEW